MKPIGIALSIGWVSTLVSPALAGEGQLVEDTTGAKLHALRLNYQFRFPPTDDEIERVKEQLQLASSVLCDATDGQLFIERVSLNAGGPNDEKADISHYRSCLATSAVSSLVATTSARAIPQSLRNIQPLGISASKPAF